MKRNTVLGAIVAMSMISGGFAFGQGNEGRNNRDQNDNAQRSNQQNQYRDRASPTARPGNQGRGNNNARRDERGAGPDHAFHTGARLPQQYRSRQYVVDDWRGHRLSAPPRGYHWVQTGGDYVLVAIATGVIMQLLLNN